MGKPVIARASKTGMLLLAFFLFCQANSFGGEGARAQVAQTKNGAKTSKTGSNRSEKSGNGAVGARSAARSTNSGKSPYKSAKNANLQKPDFLKIYDTNGDGTLDAMEMREFARQRVHRAEAIKRQAPSVPNASANSSDSTSQEQ